MRSKFGDTPMNLARVVIVLIASVTTIAARAQSVSLIGINPGQIPSPYWGFDEPTTSQSWGWEFEVKSPLVVTHVAWYDKNGDGLSHSHRVGLWSGPTDAPEVIVTPLFGSGIVIPSGTTAALDGPWRKVAVPGGTLTLQPGFYVLGGENNVNSTDPITFIAGQPKVDPRIRVVWPGYSQATGFNKPDSFFLLIGGVDVGPNLFVVPVPEPTTYAMALLAFFGVTMSWRLRRNDLL